MSRVLRIALLADGGPVAAAVAEALRHAGHQPVLLTTEPAGVNADAEEKRLRRVPDWPLRFRFMGDGLAHVPHAALAIARGRFDVAHAFSPGDALAAVACARRSGPPAVLTFVAPLQRETIGNRRLRLATLTRAVHGADAVLAADDEVQASLRRLLAIDAPVLAPADAAGHLALYRRLTPG